MESVNQKHQWEAVFHYEWAAETALSEIAVDRFFEAPTALENRFILSRMGFLRGKTILDVGCRLGESSVYFANKARLSPPWICHKAWSRMRWNSRKSMEFQSTASSEKAKN